MNEILRYSPRPHVVFALHVDLTPGRTTPILDYLADARVGMVSTMQYHASEERKEEWNGSPSVTALFKKL